MGLVGVEADAGVFEADAALAEESPEGLFEGFFAGLKDVADFLGGRLVVVGGVAAAAFEDGDDLLGEGGDALVADGVEAEVDFAVFAEGSDEALKALAGEEGKSEVGVVEEAPMAIFDDGIAAERGVVGDGEGDGLPVAIGGRGAVKKAVEAHGSSEALAAGVDVDVDEREVTDGKVVGLFADGEEQVLAEAPVEEGAGAWVVVDHGEGGEFAGLGEGGGGGGDEAVLGVAVEEDVEGVVEAGAWGDFAAWEEDFSVGAAVEVEAGGGFAEDSEGIADAELSHGWEVSRERGGGQGGVLGGGGFEVAWEAGRGSGWEEIAFKIAMNAPMDDFFPPRPRIGVVGSGAMGCYYGARLAQRGEDVTFLMRGDLAAVRERGLSIRSCAGDFALGEVAAFGSSAEMGACDLVVVALKSTANGALASLLPPLLHAGTVVVTLQNGLGNEAALGKQHRDEQVLGGVCFVCINRVGPGQIEHLSGGEVALGEYVGGPRGRTEAIGELLRASGIPCRVEASLAAVRWKKLAWNIPFNGLAIREGGITTADILADGGLAAEARALAEEAVGAAGALGHALPQGWAEHQIERTWEMGPYRPSSMIDYVEGRPVEVESIWGEPLRQALGAGAAVPRMEALYGDIVRLAGGRTSCA